MNSHVSTNRTGGRDLIVGAGGRKCCTVQEHTLIRAQARYGSEGLRTMIRITCFVAAVIVSVAGCTPGDGGDDRYQRGPRVEDIALKAGIQDRFSRLRGVAPADYDLDGDMDVFIANSGDPSRIFWNRGIDSDGDVVFQEGPVLLTEAVYFAAAADYDNDGDPDLFVGVGGNAGVGFDFLFENVDGIFVDVTESARVAGPVLGSGRTMPAGTTAGAWGDYDNDGWIDLYIATSRVKGSLPQLKGRNTLYRNLGDGTFEDVTDAAGVGDTGASWSPSWLDYDNDGLLDLYVANFRGANTLYHNEGDSTFAEATTPILERPIDAWGSLADDFNNDGWIDLFVVGRPMRPDEPGVHGLFINDRKGGFTNQALSAGLSRVDDSSTFGLWMGFQAGDFDNDGFSEIVLGQGTPGTGMENHLFLNKLSDGELHFEIATSLIGYPAPDDGKGWLCSPSHCSGTWRPITMRLARLLPMWTRIPEYPYRTHGMAFADFDEDGDLDLFIGNGGPAHRSETREPNRLFRNDFGNSNNWIRLHLIGTLSNRDGIGSRIIVLSQQATGQVNVRHRFVKGISGFGGNNPIDPHIGIGQDDKIISIAIWWPSGVLQTIEIPSINTEMTIEESRSGPFGSVQELLSLAGATLVPNAVGVP